LRVTLPFITRAPDDHGVIDTRPARSGVEEELVAPADDDAHIIIIYVPVAREYIILYYYYYTRVYNIIMRAFTTPCNIYTYIRVGTLILAHTHSDILLYTYCTLTDTRVPVLFVSDIILYCGMYRTTVSNAHDTQVPGIVVLYYNILLGHYIIIILSHGHCGSV